MLTPSRHIFGKPNYAYVSLLTKGYWRRNYLSDTNFSQLKNTTSQNLCVKESLIASKLTKYKEAFKPVFENKTYLVVNKAPGIDVQDDYLDGVKRNGLFSILISEDSNLKNVHRIDKFVSGGVLLAKSKTAARMFSKGLKKGGHSGYKMKRRYIALIANGEFPDISLDPDATIHYRSKDKEAGVIHKFNLDTKKAEVTRFYRTGEEFNDIQLLIVELETGRKHQIRRHLSQVLGKPIINDLLYNGERHDHTILNAIALHSAFIETTVGMNKQSTIIPINYTLGLWKGFINSDGSLKNSVVERLKKFPDF